MPTQDERAIATVSMAHFSQAIDVYGISTSEMLFLFAKARKGKLLGAQ